MVRAIPVPKSVFNPTTGQWEAPGIDLAPPKKNKAAYKPPTHTVFSGEKGVIAVPWCKVNRNAPMKSWKQQSSRPRQYKHK